MLLELPDIRPRNPYLSIAIDEAIAEYYGKQLKNSTDFQNLLNSGKHDEIRQVNQFPIAILRLWSNPYAIVLGRTCVASENLSESYLNSVQFNHSKAAANGDPALCRRASGGGTVLHGPGNINYSLFFYQQFFSELYPLHNSYEKILGMIQQALLTQGIETEMKGLSDIVLNYRDSSFQPKISGNAQFRKYGFICHHGTLLTGGGLIEKIAKHLKHPPREPDYRKGRDHNAFLTYLPDHFDLSLFYSCLVKAVQNYTGIESSGAMSSIQIRQISQRAKQLARSIYSNRSWILDAKYPTPSAAGSHSRNDPLSSVKIN